MSFPHKFKERLELTKEDLTLPNEVWVTYSVCGCDEDSCGWEGWVLESVLVRKGRTSKAILPSSSECLCPCCNKPVFRTEASLKMNVAKDQTPALVSGRDYETGKMDYK